MPRRISPSGSRGPCACSGHDGPITEAGFDALVGDLLISLDEFGVTTRQQGEVLSSLVPVAPRSFGR